jgi:hypothetical protein
MLTGRSEGFVVGRPDLDEAIRGLRVFAEAAAGTLAWAGLLLGAKELAGTGTVTRFQSLPDVETLFSAGWGSQGASCRHLRRGRRPGAPRPTCPRPRR